MSAVRQWFVEPFTELRHEAYAPVMRRLLAVLTVVVVAGCGGSSSADTSSAPTAPTTTADYQQVLPHCTQTEDDLIREVQAAQADLEKHGKGETEQSLVDHLTTVASAEPGRNDCLSLLAAYATLRESQ